MKLTQSISTFTTITWAKWTPMKLSNTSKSCQMDWQLASMCLKARIQTLNARLRNSWLPTVQLPWIKPNCKLSPSKQLTNLNVSSRIWRMAFRRRDRRPLMTLTKLERANLFKRRKKRIASRLWERRSTTWLPYLRSRRSKSLRTSKRRRRRP